MKLTKRQRLILELMAEGEDLVQEGTRFWIGKERTNAQFFGFCLRNTLIKERCRTNTICHYYTLSDFGRRVLRDENFDPEYETMKLVMRPHESTRFSK